MKYEVFQVTKKDLTFEVGVMHHDMLTHSDVAEHMLLCVATTYDVGNDDVAVVGAGFCTTGGYITCWGHSESLNISTRGAADEQALNSTTLNIQQVPISAFDKISSVLSNFSQSCGLQIAKMQGQRFIVGYECSAYNLLQGFSIDLEEGTLLTYLGPTIGPTGNPLHMFKVHFESKYAEDFPDIYTVNEQWMQCIFHDSPSLRQLSKRQSVVIQDGAAQPQVVNLIGVKDPWPLTNNHDEFTSYYVPLGTRECLTRRGSLEDLLNYFNLDAPEN